MVNSFGSLVEFQRNQPEMCDSKSIEFRRHKLLRSEPREARLDGTGGLDGRREDDYMQAGSQSVCLSVVMVVVVGLQEEQAKPKSPVEFLYQREVQECVIKITFDLIYNVWVLLQLRCSNEQHFALDLLLPIPFRPVSASHSPQQGPCNSSLFILLFLRDKPMIIKSRD